MKKLTTQEFIEKAKAIHNNKYCYDNSVYVGCKEKIEIYCNNCNTNFYQTPDNHISGQKGCNKCADIIRARKKRKPITKLIKEFKLIHSNLYSYSLVTDKSYINKDTNIKIICNKCDLIFKQLPSNHLRGNGCPNCAFKSKSSKCEIKWLDSLNIKEENRQISLPGLSKKIKVDGFDPETNTVYEFNGDYWHGNPNIYKSEDMNYNAKKTFGELYQNTLKKSNKIIQAGYHLISIWESDWKDICDE